MSHIHVYVHIFMLRAAPGLLLIRIEILGSSVFTEKD